MNTLQSIYYISLFLVTTILFLETSEAADTLNSSQILRDNGTTLISSGGTFELGFYSLENSDNRYVGIWYKNIPVKTVVWVANRNNPLTDRSGMLKVVKPGLLALVNGTDSIIWSTNTSSGMRNPFAKLLDSGNLVMADANDANPDNYLWESFNYPTDTFLPGMKLGINFITGQEVYLTSPVSSTDPSSGEYTCHCDPTGYPQIVIKKGGASRVRTGPWNGLGFNGNPLLRNNDIFTFGLVMNKNEVYYHYELMNNSVVTRFNVSESGYGKMWVWSDDREDWVILLSLPSDDCDIYNLCGSYGKCNIDNSPLCGCLSKFRPKDGGSWERGNWSNGCIQRTPLECRNDDGFLTYSGKLPDAKRSWFNKSMSLEECKQLCLQNCSCTAYASQYIDGNGCLLWFGDLVDIRDLSAGQDIYIRIAASDLGSKRKKREVIIVTLSLVIGVPLLCLSMLLYTWQRKKLDHQMRETGRPGYKYMERHSNENRTDIELPLFEFSKITKATNNFAITNKLGQGGFGPVYKGLLEEGHEIAVKCLSSTSRQGVDEFKNEVICIARLQHRNLVKLLGCCIKREEMILVYEYMANRSLDLILFDHTKSILLDWPKRFNIINGIARGLLYLHHDSRLRVIHRDLKASNILLDCDMNPKISDFGLAKTFAGNEIGADTSQIVGTYGYMSPEYVMNGIFSVKSDIFSFGVIVLEIISGNRNRGFSHNDHLLNLLGHAWMLYRDENSLDLVDSCLRNSCYLSEMLRCIHIGLLCVQESPEDRPNMSSVVLMLSNDVVLPEAKHPGFFTARDQLNIESVVTPNEACSTNTTTFSLPEAR